MPTKTRERIVILSHNDHIFRPPTGAEVVFLDYIPPYPYYSFQESMSGSNTSRRGAWNACLHKRFESTIWAGETDDQYGGSSHIYKSGLLYSIVLSSGLVPAYNSIPEVPSIDWNDFDYKAWAAMHPQIKTDISLVNFVLELKDLKRLPDLWSAMRSRLKNLANLHLNYSFGWMPFLSDVWALYSAMFRMRKRILDFIDGANKAKTVHYSWKVPSHTASVTHDITFYGSPRFITVEDEFSEVELHATMQYSYTVGNYSKLVSELGGWLDALGINLNLQIIWNAIPFSFVVDWFFNVGQWLGSQKGEVLPVITSVTRYMHSCKYSVTRTVRFSSPGGESLVYLSKWSHYQREFAIPRTSPGLVPRLPNLGQILLGGSLTVANSR